MVGEGVLLKHTGSV